MELAAELRNTTGMEAMANGMEMELSLLVVVNLVPIQNIDTWRDTLEGWVSVVARQWEPPFGMVTFTL